MNWNSLSLRGAETNFSITKSYAGRMALPFTPLAISFQDVNYYVDAPVVIIML